MGQSSSSNNSNQVTPEPPRTESWSTLKGFVAAETAAEKNPEVLADSTVVNDKKIERVKTWMKFPERQPKSTFQLDLHVNQSIHRGKTQAHFSDNSPEIDAILGEENPALPLKYKLQKHKSQFMQQSGSGRVARQPTRVLVEPQASTPGYPPSATSPTVNVQYPEIDTLVPRPAIKTIQQPSRLHLERKMTQSRHLGNVKFSHMEDPDRLQLSVDASSNLRQEPTDQEIKRQIQRWKTEVALEKDLALSSSKIYKKPSQPKHAKSFYELRKAMVHREDVSLEQSTSVIGSVSRRAEEDKFNKEPGPSRGSPKKKGSIQASLTPAEENKSAIAQKTDDIKMYDGEQSFGFTINKDSPPGFNAVTEVSELDKKCKDLVDMIKVKEKEANSRKEIDELLQLWKISGFLKNIEDYVHNFPAKKNNSVSEISQQIASMDASYLNSVSDVDVHVQLAKAYAIYCWIANNITSYITEEDEFKPTSDDYSNLFMRIALHANLEVKVIRGQVRTWTNMTDDFIFLSSHSWNAVKIDDVFLQLDCTFGSGQVDFSSNELYTPDYFAVPPHHFILTHWPADPSYQFLELPLSLQEIQPVLPVPVTTLKEGIVPVTWSKNLNVSTQLPVVAVDVNVNTDHHVKLFANLVPEPEMDLPSDSFEQNVHVRQEGKKWNIQAAVPLKGQYTLNIYSKIDGCNKKPCLSYLIWCDTESELKLGYPKLNDAALATYSFNLIHWNNPVQSYVCQNLSGLLNMVFEAKPNLNFDHFISPGRVPNPELVPEENKKCYNTLLLHNGGTNNLSLYQLQAVFPSNGWWTVSLSASDHGNSEHPSWKYTSLLSYYVYVAIGLPRNSYPRIFSPDILFNGIKPIMATGDDFFTLHFASSKHLVCSHCLVFDEESFKGFTQVDFCGKMRNQERFVYSLKVIFPWPGNWYVHVLGQEKDKGQDLSLFKLNIAVNGSIKNTSFVEHNCIIAESLGVCLVNDGLLTFIDDGLPLKYCFEALSTVNVYHSLKSQENEQSSLDYCTYLSSDPSSIDESKLTHTIHAVFPYSGKWSVQVFAAKKESSNYSLVISLNVRISNPSLQLCYPKINSAFHQFKMNIDPNQALMKKNCENGEFQLSFTAPEDYFFSWSMELLSTGEKLLSSAFVHYNHIEPHNRSLHVIFPKPGEWLIRLFSKQITDLSSKYGNFRPVIELRLNSLSSKSGIAFPQVFEQFYSTFKLQLDRKHIPLISEVHKVPTKIVIPIYSPEKEVQFCHDVDVKCEDETNETFTEEDQCKIISDPSTGHHEVIMEVNSKGKWTVSLYAKKAGVTDKSWITVLKYSISSI